MSNNNDKSGENKSEINSYQNERRDTDASHASSKPAQATKNDTNDDTGYTPLLNDNNDKSQRKSSSNDGDISLSIRSQRLLRWSIIYFIFGIASFTGNNFNARGTVEPKKLKNAYQMWAASDFFLIIGAILLFFEASDYYFDKNAFYNNNELYRYICGGLFILAGILRIIGLILHNDAVCNNSHCTTLHFCQDYMATYFSILIGVDIIIDKILDELLLRIFSYSSLTTLLTIIVAIWYSKDKHNYKQNSQIIKGTKAYKITIDGYNTNLLAFWVLFFVLLFIAIISGLMKFAKKGLELPQNQLKNLFWFDAFLLITCIGIVFWSNFFIYQTWLYIFSIVMIAYDIQFIVLEF